MQAQNTSLGLAQGVANNLDSIYPAVDPKCSILRVLAKGTTPGFQVGVAWNLGGYRGKNQFLTPAHVVQDSQKIILLCQKRSIRVRVVQSSPAYDLALLEAAQPIEGLDQQALLADDQKTWRNPQVFAGVELIPEKDKIVVPWNKGYRVLYDLLSKDPAWNQDLGHLGFPLVYRTSRVAVAQGMSGSPVLGSNTTYGPLGRKTSDLLIQGMVTKTLVNGSESFVLPTQQILKALDFLRANQDPFFLNHPNLKIEKLLVAGNTVTRITQTTDGKYVEESCPHSAWQESSGAWADGAGAWADGSGAWADGGGQATENDGDFKLLTKNLFVSSSMDRDLSSLRIHYLGAPGCANPVLKNSQGQVLAGISDSSGYTKVRSLEETFAKALLRHESFDHFFARFQKPDNLQKEVMQRFCFGFQKKYGAQAEFMGNPYPNYLVNLADKSTVVVDQLMDMHQQILPNSGINRADENWSRLSCSEGQMSLEIYVGANPLIKVKISDNREVRGQVFTENGPVDINGRMLGWSFVQDVQPNIRVAFDLGALGTEPPAHLQMTIKKDQQVIYLLNMYVGR